MKLLLLLDSYITSLDPTYISIFLPVILAIVASYFALRQLRTQFRHKVIHEGWKEFQSKLFVFSSELTNFASNLQQLPYDLKNINSFIYTGKSPNHKQEILDIRWQSSMDSYLNLSKAYVNFLISYETHEKIFLPLATMKKTFANEWDREMGDYIEFLWEIFPRMAGRKDTKSVDEKKDLINAKWNSVNELQAYLEDFRVELQNETIGKILGGRSVPLRVPDSGKGFKLLTKNGLKEV